MRKQILKRRIMVRKYLRLIIAGILFTGSIALFFNGSVSLGIWSLLVSGIFVLFHFKNEMNLTAFYFVRKNKFKAAARVLGWVKHPESMIQRQEAYYYFLCGLVDSQQNNISSADKNFKKALNTGLHMTNDQAVAKLNLAGIALTQRNKKMAAHYLQETKKLDKSKLLITQIREIEDILKRM